jgi:uncharacterized membrane protein YeaQ/YmgE (transglycosylase-associated protein family)
MVGTGLLYFGFFIFLFVVGGIAGDIAYHEIPNIFIIGGLVVGIIGTLIGRFILSLMRI